MLVHKYIPEKALPEKVRDGCYEEVPVEEFIELIAKADLMRELVVEDIRIGFLKAVKDMCDDG
ncbi:MAG: hypothetical protein HFG77_07405 [Hungatella sp.]|nr:hypothetical protein [Hungatella sp.]